MKLAAIIIPTRGRFDLLVKSIQSLHATADVKNFDVFLKVDLCDSETLVALRRMPDFGNVYPIVSPRNEGYASIDYHCSKIADACAAQWIMIFNDDAIMQGNRWDEKLADIPRLGFIVQPEVYQLNESKYPLCEGGAFPFVPNGCWRNYGWEHLMRPSDTQLDRLLRINNGWKTRFLEGITVVHDRAQPIIA